MKSALLSVWDKRGLVPLARRLRGDGWQLIASGGTAQKLERAGLEVTSVRNVTGEPELFGGRVKTLHPAIHSGILAPDTEEAHDQLQSKGWPKISLVVVNLYPFQDVVNQPEFTHTQAIEHIDIGGVALLRAAAKNHQRVTALCDPDDYPQDLSVLGNPSYRKNMAHKAFATTAAYDSAIARYFGGRVKGPTMKPYTLHPAQRLRYGENPHQEGAFYARQPGGTPFHGNLLQGKPLSYNNLLDLEGAWRCARRFEKPAAVIVKHTSPCGVAEAEDIEAALPLAIASDTVSAFGSVIAGNRTVNVAFVEALGDLFFECLIAPNFTQESLRELAKNQDLRVIQAALEKPLPGKEIRTLPGGYLEQEIDAEDPEEAPGWQVMTERQPTSREMKALRFAWKAVIDVKSNAVLLAKAEGGKRFTVGIGGGQPNRVDCVRIAGLRAGEKAQGSVLASDAFFPFPDGIRLAADLGAMAVVQPGGSIRDPDVITEANEQGVAMLFTGVRHFRH